MDEENTTQEENTGAEETTTAEAPAAETAAPAADGGGGGGEGKRPVFLTVLCILTFIGSGLGLLGSILLMVGVGALADMLGGMGGGMLDGGTAYFGVAALLAAGSLFGAIQMWKMKKMGFYLYVVANLVGAILPMIWLGMPFSFMTILWPIVFIVLYGLNLKHMS